MKLLTTGLAAAALCAAADSVPATFKQFCFGCHSKVASGGISLEKLLAAPVGHGFTHWEKVVGVLEQKRMPPPKLPHPTDSQRQAALDWVRSELDAYARKHAGDPGRVTVRRLTSAEYAYTIRDLTGLDLRFDGASGTDAVGGEGFTNFGDVQFVHDASIDRYLESARRVADHAVIGAGPLSFFDDPGKSGMELSAIDRIQKIYRAHGFRSVAAEGAIPYGLDRYAKAFYAAWRYHHRAALGLPTALLAKFAADERISPRFVEHVAAVVSQPAPAYPVSEVVARWRALPAPGSANEDAIRAACEDIKNFVVDWPRYVFAAGELAKGGQGDERALILSDASLQSSLTHKFRFALRNGDSKTSKVYLTAVSLRPESRDHPRVQWRNATVRMRTADRAFGPPVPLRAVLREDEARRLFFDAEGNFSTEAGRPVEVEIPFADDARGVELTVDAAIPSGVDAVLRCTVSDKPEVSKGRPVWAMLADVDNAGVRAWRSGVLAFAAQLPQNSQGEPTPADRDEIPAPFDNTYNQPERDHFHAKLKYFRKDRFLVEKVLDDSTRRRLDQAWADLLTSFDYHDLFAQFVAKKYKLPGDIRTSRLTPAAIAALPPEPRGYIQSLHREYLAARVLERAGAQRHVTDALRFAAIAWRRPLSENESAALRTFYARSRQAHGLDHTGAVRALLARILVGPAFLYRLEPTQAAGLRPLTSWEIASRLSYFLWSSLPDDELRRAAAASELTQPRGIEAQVCRMLADPKARRFATEFFGQWLGFYRFDEYSGVDTKRFPEFTAEVRSAMYEEAVSFFDHIVRKDRPVREILFGDYTFLNGTLAKYYGAPREIAAQAPPERVDGAAAFGRGGLLRMGAMLTSTSAPLRTSPVKRGDWMLRRILGTPTPPPPADAGSIPADEKAFGGLSLREKMELHKRNATCAGCHTRIDPLGFPFEKYDSIGRRRSQYADGKAVDDSSTLAEGKPVAGVDGLLEYLHTQQRQVMRTMSYKLLGYALGRTVLASDQPLVDRLIASGDGAPLSKLVSEIALSKQFRYRREETQALQEARR